ncbi:fluoride efflux transporter CrcB [Flavobacterium sp.]|uniref:fluoride efflux transporter CrcB n=1 Tax=Flavobacterium sp. TaxID=239 RepID=UPI002B4B05A7|nr:fluoride efflux transporter CrcB [Flavobacterium sp.]HLF50967.1 fluoride efflux transporter CrcB [Flavobacterium sp.]
MIRTLVLIALGGGIGSVFRYLTSVMAHKYYASIFPLATLTTNVLGCFLIGLIVGLLEKNHMTNSDLKWFLITGFCGGYTTFSAFGYENISLMQSNNSGLAFVYIGVSIITGLFAVWLGLFLTK